MIHQYEMCITDYISQLMADPERAMCLNVSGTISNYISIDVDETLNGWRWQTWGLASHKTNPNIWMIYNSDRQAYQFSPSAEFNERLARRSSMAARWLRAQLAPVGLE